MAEWNLHLTEDLYGKTHPVFSSLSERVEGYRGFYCTDQGTQASDASAGSPSLEEFSASPSSLDTRKSMANFSAMMTLYDSSGTEYTFSPMGMRRVQRQIPWQGHYHTHEYIEILYVIQGSFEQILLGEHRTFLAGECVITDQNLVHADYLSKKENTAVLFLSLQRDYLDQLLSSYDHKDDLQRFFFHALRRQQKEQSYLHLRPEHPGQQAETDHILEIITQESFFPREGSPLIIQGYLIRFLSLLCRDYHMQLHSSDQESKEKAFLYELERYIRLHYATVTSAELEQVFHYHRNYYHLILQKYRGVSFRTYVRQIRLDNAARLLTTTNLPTREIGMLVGYHNNSHFYHLFEEQFGKSPGEYRA